jgi:hypothetical protein
MVAILTAHRGPHDTTWANGGVAQGRRISGHRRLYRHPRDRWYEPRYTCETQGCLSMAMAAHRLANLDIQAPGYAVLLHRLLSLWRGQC